MFNVDINPQDIFGMDEFLIRLAFYDVTHGMIKCIKTHEQHEELQESIANKFNYFKKLIQTGEMSIEEIKNDILFKNGPINQKINKNTNNLIDGFKEHIGDMKEQNVNSIFDDFAKDFFKNRNI